MAKFQELMEAVMQRQIESTDRKILLEEERARIELEKSRIELDTARRINEHVIEVLPKNLEKSPFRIS